MQEVRTETCLAIRMLSLAWYLVMYGIPFLVLVPIGQGTTLSLLILQEWASLGEKSLCMKVRYKGGTANAITNIRANVRNLDKLIALMAKGLKREELTWSST